MGSCVRLMASHPAFAHQYGNSSEILFAAWSRLLGFDAFRGIVFEEINGTGVRIFGVGVLVFVTDEFVEEAKRAPGECLEGRGRAPHNERRRLEG